VTLKIEQIFGLVCEKKTGLPCVDVVAFVSAIFEPTFTNYFTKRKIFADAKNVRSLFPVDAEHYFEFESHDSRASFKRILCFYSEFL
jgi:hypothetical protein